MSNRNDNKSNQWSKYGFILALLIGSEALLLQLAKAGVVRAQDGLFALALPASVFSTLLLALIAVMVGGMAMMCFVFWRTNREVAVPEPWPMFMCVGLMGLLGSVVILTKPHDALHFLLFVLFGYASYQWLRATQRIWLS